MPWRTGNHTDQMRTAVRAMIGVGCRLMRFAFVTVIAGDTRGTADVVHPGEMEVARPRNVHGRDKNDQ